MEHTTPIVAIQNGSNSVVLWLAPMVAAAMMEPT
jgi:hypothetical protein